MSSVLGEAAIANFAIAELALHHTEHMLDLRAHLAEAAGVLWRRPGPDMG
jgi:hypothetical protein